ncbi:MAG: DUF881 domain-containing protein [Clostridia bacterium]|nr:DUF881 domain-containing protein [Clostridia bacterium]
MKEMHNKKVAISLGILTMLFTAGTMMQFKTIRAANLDGTIQLTDRNLKKSVLQWNEKYQESTKKLKDTDEELEELKKKVAEFHIDEELKEKIDKYEIILGMTDVSGEGIIVTVSDNDGYNNQNSFASINASNYLVHDGNLVAIVNELKAAGAEAISINDKRITDTTAITCAGNVIQVNGEKVGSPFTIKAIGNKDLLYGEITKNGGIIYKLKRYGVITEIKKNDNIEISKNL